MRQGLDQGSWVIKCACVGVDQRLSVECGAGETLVVPSSIERSTDHISLRLRARHMRFPLGYGKLNDARGAPVSLACAAPLVLQSLSSSKRLLHRRLAIPIYPYLSLGRASYHRIIHSSESVPRDTQPSLSIVRHH